MSSAFVICRRSPVLARHPALMRPEKLQAAWSRVSRPVPPGEWQVAIMAVPVLRGRAREPLRLGHAPGSCAAPHRLPFPRCPCSMSRPGPGA